MHIKRTVESEKIYQSWLKSMNQIDDSESKEVILLPIKHSFEAVGLCGSSGIAKVPTILQSLRSTTTNSYSKPKSKIVTNLGKIF